MPAKKTTKKLETPAATHKKAAPRATARPRVRKPAAAQAPEPKPLFDASLHHGEIAREAYFLWEARGRAHGHEAEDWFRAIELVRSRYE